MKKTSMILVFIVTTIIIQPSWSCDTSAVCATTCTSVDADGNCLATENKYYSCVSASQTFTVNNTLPWTVSNTNTQATDGDCNDGDTNATKYTLPFNWDGAQYSSLPFTVTDTYQYCACL
jgi:hypothetical protein